MKSGVGEAVLLLAVLACGASEFVVLDDSRFCRNVSSTENVCNYTNVTREVKLTPKPNGCEKWETLKLVGARSLEVIVSCFKKITVSSSQDVNVTVYKDEEQRNMALSIDHSSVTSLKGHVGPVRISNSNVTSLRDSPINGLNLKSSSVGSLNSVEVHCHDCQFTDTTIESLDDLKVAGDQPFNMTGGRLGVVKSLTFTSRAFSTLDQVVIDHVQRGGLRVTNGSLTLKNVTIKFLAKRAIVINGGAVSLSDCKIEGAVFDSVTLNKGGSLQLSNTYIGETQYNFAVGSPTMTFPFTLVDHLRGFSTASMVGSAFLGALITFVIALVTILVLRHRLVYWVNVSEKDTASTPAVSKNDPYDDVGSLTEADQGDISLQDIKINLPPPPPPPAEQEIEEGESKTSFGRNPVSNRPNPGLGLPPDPPTGLSQRIGQGPKAPSELPLGLGRPPQPPSGLPPGLGLAPEPPSGLPQRTGQGPQAPSELPPGLGRPPQPPTGLPPGRGRPPQPPGGPPHGLLQEVPRQPRGFLKTKANKGNTTGDRVAVSTNPRTKQEFRDGNPGLYDDVEANRGNDGPDDQQDNQEFYDDVVLIK